MPISLPTSNSPTPSLGTNARCVSAAATAAPVVESIPSINYLLPRIAAPCKPKGSLKATLATVAGYAIFSRDFAPQLQNEGLPHVLVATEEVQVDGTTKIKLKPKAGNPRTTRASEVGFYANVEDRHIGTLTRTEYNPLHWVCPSKLLPSGHKAKTAPTRKTLIGDAADLRAKGFSFINLAFGGTWTLEEYPALRVEWDRVHYLRRWNGSKIAKCLGVYIRATAANVEVGAGPGPVLPTRADSHLWVTVANRNRGKGRYYRVRAAMKLMGELLAGPERKAAIALAKAARTKARVEAKDDKAKLEQAKADYAIARKEAESLCRHVAWKEDFMSTREEIEKGVHYIFGFPIKLKDRTRITDSGLHPEIELKDGLRLHPATPSLAQGWEVKNREPSPRAAPAEWDGLVDPLALVTAFQALAGYRAIRHYGVPTAGTYQPVVQPPAPTVVEVFTRLRSVGPAHLLPLIDLVAEEDGTRCRDLPPLEEVFQVWGFTPNHPRAVLLGGLLTLAGDGVKPIAAPMPVKKKLLIELLENHDLDFSRWAGMGLSALVWFLLAFLQAAKLDDATPNQLLRVYRLEVQPGVWETRATVRNYTTRDELYAKWLWKVDLEAVWKREEADAAARKAKAELALAA